MTIKIVSHNNKESGKRRIKIQKSPGLMSVIFHNTATNQKVKIRLMPSLSLTDTYTLLEKLEFIIILPKHFRWNFYHGECLLDLNKSPEENGIQSGDEIAIKCQILQNTFETEKNSC